MVEKPDADVVVLEGRAASDDRETLLPGIDALYAEAFAVTPYAGLTWAATAWQFVIYDGADAQRVVASTLGLLVRRCFVADTPVLVGGIAGVATLQAARSRGYATQLLHAAAAKMRTLALPFGLLQCPDHRISFYEANGWRRANTPMRFDQPDGSSHPILENPMVLQLGDAAWPAGAIDMNGAPW
jgi:GNAT superfamily N-acetyltransferase